MVRLGDLSGRLTANELIFINKGDHARQDSMEAWSKNGISDIPLPPPLERWHDEIFRHFCESTQTPFLPFIRRKFREKNRAKAHSIVGTPNYIGKCRFEQKKVTVSSLNANNSTNSDKNYSFTAPEVLLRSGYTQLCDWWSVGVILYEMLVGQPPFLASTAEETQYKVSPIGINPRACFSNPFSTPRWFIGGKPWEFHRRLSSRQRRRISSSGCAKARTSASAKTSTRLKATRSSIKSIGQRNCGVSKRPSSRKSSTRQTHPTSTPLIPISCVTAPAMLKIHLAMSSSTASPGTTASSSSHFGGFSMTKRITRFHWMPTITARPELSTCDPGSGELFESHLSPTVNRMETFASSFVGEFKLICQAFVIQIVISFTR